MPPPDPEYLKLLERYGAAIQKIALAARKAILEEAPEASEFVYEVYTIADHFAFTERPSDAFVFTTTHANWVNLGFNFGTLLPDPKGLLRGEGKMIRHVRLAEPAGSGRSRCAGFGESRHRASGPARRQSRSAPYGGTHRAIRQEEALSPEAPRDLTGADHLRPRLGTITPRGLAGAALLELIYNSVEIGISGAKASREPVSTACGNALAVGDHLKLTFGAVGNHRAHAEPLLDEGHETRDLGFVIASRGAGNDLDLHFGHPRRLYHRRCAEAETVTHIAGRPSDRPGLRGAPGGSPQRPRRRAW